MPPTRDGGPAAALAAALRALPLEIESVEVVVDEVRLSSYPGGARPTSTVALSADGCRGSGEHVAWTAPAHLAFARRARALGDDARRCTTVGAFSMRVRAMADPYDRAALEAAAIDLALAEADTPLGALIGVAPRPARYVVSFTPQSDPAGELRSLVGDGPEVDAKIDVDPKWAPAIFEALAATGRVAVLDWKRSGLAEDHRSAHRILPDALLEDPGADPLAPCPAILARWSVDAPLTHHRALAGTLARGRLPVAANVKPARMGGVLEALDTVAWCAAHGVGVYFGGMFEIGAARRQLRDLACLLSPDAPNDVAPLSPDAPNDEGGRERPSRLVTPGAAGFGREWTGEPRTATAQPRNPWRMPGRTIDKGPA